MTEPTLCPQCGKTLGDCQCLRPNSQPTLSQHAENLKKHAKYVKEQHTLSRDVLEAVPAWGQALLDRVASLYGYIKSDKLTVQHLAERVARLEEWVTEEDEWHEKVNAAVDKAIREIEPRGPHD